VFGKTGVEFSVLCVGRELWTCRLLCLGDRCDIVDYCAWGEMQLRSFSLL